MSPSLADIRKQFASPLQPEPANIESADEKGSTSSFDPTGRQKYVQLMTAIGLVGNDKSKKTLEMLRANFGNDPLKIGGYWCYNCEYFKEKFGSPTGYWCGQFLFPDYPYECCNGYSAKEKEE